MSLLTIKHVEKDGHESIQQAHSVSFVPYDEESKVKKSRLDAFGCTGQGGTVDDDGCCSYSSGIVYVMNDAGSTVGKYDLN